MTILIDIDSTATNFASALLHCLNNFYDHHEYSEIASYDWFEQTYNDPWYPTTKKEFWDTVYVNQDVIKTVEKWIDNGYKVYFVSATYFSDAMGYKLNKFISAFNPKYINESNIIIAQHKNMIKGDILIDDCVENLEHFDGGKICFAQPWNEEWNYEQGHGGMRYNDWGKIDTIINEIYDIYFKNM